MATDLQAIELEGVEPQDAAAWNEAEGDVAVLDDRDSTSREKPADDLMSIEEAKQSGYDWPVVVWIVVVHAGALAAPFFFTWKAVAICAFLCWLTGSIGVCMGYHRQLTHGSFATYRPMRWLLALLGGLSGEGSALDLGGQPSQASHVSATRKAIRTARAMASWWSHMLWFMPDFGRKHHDTMLARYAPDLAKDPVMRFLHKAFLPSHVLMGVAAVFGRLFRLERVHRLVVRRVGDVRAAGLRAARDLVRQFGHAPVGLSQLTRRPTTARTCGGSASWRSARAGTTITTPSSGWPRPDTSGGKST